MNLQFVGVGGATLADDTTVGFRVHRVTAMWGGKLREINVDAVGSTPLVGMPLLFERHLGVDVTVGGRVVGQPIL